MQSRPGPNPKLSLLKAPHPRPLLGEPEEILITKLGPSFVSGPLLQRSRLLARLNSNPNASLVLVHGAAGSGKTSLLHNYLKMQDLQAAWYSLEESDQDGKIFLQYFFNAIGIPHPDLARPFLERLERLISVAEEWKNLLVHFINAVHRYRREVWIILDDYHHLKDSYPIPDIMKFLLLHAPPNFRCFVATRDFPNLPLAFLGSKNSLIFISPVDLRLDKEELSRLFNTVWNIPLSEKSLEMIDAKTEGWFAAARLLAQTLRNRKEADAAHYLKNLDLKDSLIYDYLAHEVYACQPENLKTFLRQTSVLRSFNADLAEFLTRLPDARDLVRKLEQMNLFVVHLDEREEWFRYHHLLAECLQSLLEREDGEAQVRALHSRAGEGWEGRKQFGEAIEHYLKGKNYAAATRLLKEHGQEMLHKGALTSLLRWLNEIPSRIFGASPDLLFLKGQIHDAAGSWEKSKEAYEKAIVLLKKENLVSQIPKVLDKLILCLIRYGEYSKISRCCQEALETCDPQDKALRSKLLTRMGIAAVVKGAEEWSKGYSLLKEGYQAAHDSGDPEAIATASIGYGFGYHFPRGNFADARHVLSEGANLLTRRGFQFLACNPIMNKAVVEIHGGMLEDAEQTILSAAELSEKYHLYLTDRALDVTRIMLRIKKKDFAEADRLSTHVMEQDIPPQLKPWYYRSVAILRAQQGNLEQAMVAGKEMLDQLRLMGPGMYAPECCMAMGFLCWKKNLRHQARKWFEEALAVAEKGEMKFWMMKAHHCLAAYFIKLIGGSLDFKIHYVAAVKITKENGYEQFWVVDPFGFTIPVLFEAFRLKVEAEETRRLTELVKPMIIGELEQMLKEGTGRLQTAARQVLDILEVPAKTAKPENGHGRNAIVKKPAGFPQPLKIRTLGELEVTRGNEKISAASWERPKALKLFKYLLSIYPKEAIPDQLIEIFWPALPIAKARHMLIVSLNQIRRALNPSGHRKDETFIQVKGETCNLLLRKEDRLDFAEMQSSCRQGDLLWKDGNSESAVKFYKTALRLYIGDFLEEEKYSEWSQSRREELKALYLSVLERVGLYHEEKKEFQEAIACYKSHLRSNPLEERIFQSLLRCFLVMGDRISARKEYDRFKGVLKAHFSEESYPSFEDLMTHNPSTRS